MSFSNELQEKIQQLHQDTPDNVHTVYYGFKEKNGNTTGELGIIFGVATKLPASQVPEGEMLPKEVEIQGAKIITDVKQEDIILPAACFPDGDLNITRLQGATGNQEALLPVKGGQQIYKAGRLPADGRRGVGTLGFLAVDDIDDRIVGVTNSHVMVDNSINAYYRNKITESYDPYNTFEWQISPPLYYEPPYAEILDLYQRYNLGFVKRYMPTFPDSNKVDAALISINPEYADVNSYQIWGPLNIAQETSYLTFATSTEINNLLQNNDAIYSTGRTTGPKGWSTDPTCALKVTGIYVSASIKYPRGTQTFNSLIKYRYGDGGLYPINAGDSGSGLIAKINGVKKIIGLSFAGSTTEAFACNIIDVASEMRIRAWDQFYTPNWSTTKPSGLVIPASSNNILNTTVSYDGKTYFQVGFTKNQYPVVLP